jgi:hypothetical protein
MSDDELLHTSHRPSHTAKMMHEELCLIFSLRSDVLSGTPVSTSTRPDQVVPH